MSKTKAIILACCTLILGAVSSALITRQVLLAYMKLTSLGVEAASYTDASQSVMLLYHLRRGDAQFPSHWRFNLTATSLSCGHSTRIPRQTNATLIS